ncbi:MAG: serine acetyltransferase [Deltaproteobacteria bacterium]|nr:serine acetyltransferase [Deltaproteobacteria bacterium]
MPEKLKTEEQLGIIHNEIVKTYDLQGGINHVEGVNLPSNPEMVDIVKKLMHLLFPGFYSVERIHSGNLSNWSGYILDAVYQRLFLQILRSLCFDRKQNKHQEHQEEAEKITLEVLAQIPKIRVLLKKDVEAAYIGDPAAQSHEEVIMSYPSIQAISLHRFAHEMYIRDVPLIPRMISEYAHTKTGIDIHPGSIIGESLFIDHGTGVVIGETCRIGDNVKIYQGVTLGALSFRKDDNGALVKGQKRHPTIEDNVVLYAGCNILGGDTVIGRDSVIGGNVWITESVPSRTVITFDVTKQEYRRFQKK